MLGLAECPDCGVKQFGLQNVEIAGCTQNRAQRAHGALDRLDALAAQ